jgi:hypothetical protein
MRATGGEFQIRLFSGELLLTVLSFRKSRDVGLLIRERISKDDS